MSEIGTVKLKRGHVREDGMVFWTYHRGGKEWWVTKEKMEDLREKRRAIERRRYAKWAEKNREKARARGRLDVVKRKDARRDYHLRSHFGITMDEYGVMLKAQGGVCAICKDDESVIMFGKKVNLAVDHCHGSGLVRGLLCRNCNTAIGLLGDNPVVIRAAADYVAAAKNSHTFSYLEADFTQGQEVAQ